MALTKKQLALIEGQKKPESEKVLSVKNLVINFRTDNGLVQAVRGVSFDLYRGETLCIVGESGSGKSVTSKAIMGILSKNAIVEGGQIIYEGEDLLRVSEDEFHRIRGHKIGMIFQDPLSSLNPIVKIGKQLIETMMINSNQLKNRYNDLIAKELVDYKNAKFLKDSATLGAKRLVSEAKKNARHDIEKANNAIAAAKAECKEAIRVAKLGVKKDDAAAMAEYSKKAEAAEAKLQSELPALEQALAEAKAAAAPRIKEAKEKAKVKLAEAKKAYGETAPELKAKLKAAKVAAKANNKEYKAKLTEERDAKLKEIDAKKASIVLSEEAKHKIAEIDHVIRQTKIRYNARIALAYFDAKRKFPLIALRDKALDDLYVARSAYTKELDAVEAERQRVLNDFQNKVRITKNEAKRRAISVMREVGIPQPEKRFYQYPFQFSGGMRQRIVIAIALTADPDILICDEPTTALDVTIQAQILELINRLKDERQLSCIFITHDLGVVANMADRVAVMYAGKICEYGTDKEVFFDPRHPYTWALLSSIPDVNSKEKLEAIPGTPPDMIYPPKGDAFALRNKYALAIDFKYQPPFFKVSETHYAATWLLYPGAPKVEMPKIVSARIQKALEDEEALTK